MVRFDFALDEDMNVFIMEVSFLTPSLFGKDTFLEEGRRVVIENTIPAEIASKSNKKFSEVE